MLDTIKNPREAASLASLATLLQTAGILLDRTKKGRYSPKAWKEYRKAKEAAHKAVDRLDEGAERTKHRQFIIIVSDSILSTPFAIRRK